MDDMQIDLRALLEAIKDNRSAMAAQIADMDRKLDDFPNKLDQVRRNQAAAVDQLRREVQSGQAELRRELASLFVPRTEYDPKHAILIERITRVEGIIERVSQQQEQLAGKIGDHVNTATAKFSDYDRIVHESRSANNTFIVMQEDIKMLKADLEKASTKGSTTLARALAVGAFLISLIDMLFQFVQHVSIR